MILCSRVFRGHSVSSQAVTSSFWGVSVMRTCAWERDRLTQPLSSRLSPFTGQKTHPDVKWILRLLLLGFTSRGSVVGGLQICVCLLVFMRMHRKMCVIWSDSSCRRLHHLPEGAFPSCQSFEWQVTVCHVLQSGRTNDPLPFSRLSLNPLLCPSFHSSHLFHKYLYCVAYVFSLQC